MAIIQRGHERPEWPRTARDRIQCGLRTVNCSSLIPGLSRHCRETCISDSLARISAASSMASPGALELAPCRPRAGVELPARATPWWPTGRLRWRSPGDVVVADACGERSLRRESRGKFGADRAATRLCVEPGPAPSPPVLPLSGRVCVSRPLDAWYSVPSTRTTTSTASDRRAYHAVAAGEASSLVAA